MVTVLGSLPISLERDIHLRSVFSECHHPINPYKTDTAVACHGTCRVRDDSRHCWVRAEGC